MIAGVVGAIFAEHHADPKAPSRRLWRWSVSWRHDGEEHGEINQRQGVCDDPRSALIAIGEAVPHACSAGTCHCQPNKKDAA